MRSSLWIGKLGVASLALATILLTGCGSSKPAVCTGGERCDCYPNKTCDNGLACLSNMCVLATPAGSGGVLGGFDVAPADTSVTTSTGGNGGTAIPPAGTGGVTIPPVGTGGVTVPPAGTGGATIPPAGTGGVVILPIGTGGVTIPPVGTGGVTIPPSGIDGGTIIATGGTGGIGTGGVGGTNLVKNGDFSQGKLYWDLTMHAGDVGAQSYTAGQYCVYNESAAAYLSFSLGYPSSPSDAFAVDAGASYTFSYQVKGWASIEAKVGGAVTPYTAVTSFTDSASSTSTIQTITHVITPTTSVAQTGLVFNGTLYYLDSVCFDNVILVKN